MMADPEEPELFDMEVVSENVQDQGLDYRFSGAAHTNVPKESQQTNVKRIIYIEEDSSDTSVESDCEVNPQSHHKHTTQKITIQNIAENNKVFLKRKLDLSPTSDQGTSPRVKYSNLSGSSSLLDLSHLNKLLDNAVTNTPALKQFSPSSRPTVKKIEPISLQDTSNSQIENNEEKEVGENQKLSLNNSQLPHYPSAFKLGLAEFAALQSIGKAADLFRISRKVIQGWVDHQDELRQDSYVEWDKDLFLDVITVLADNETICLSDLIARRKATHPKTLNCSDINFLKWSVKWCRLFKLELNSKQEVTRETTLKLPGSAKVALASEASDPASTDEKTRTFSPEFKLQAVRFADKYSFKACAEKYNLKTSTIRRWFCERIVLEKRLKPEPTTRITFSRKRLEILDDELSEWYKSMAGKGKVTRQSLLFSKARSLARKLNLEDFEPTSQWYNQWSSTYLTPSETNSQKAEGSSVQSEASLLENEECSRRLQEECDDLPNTNYNSKTVPKNSKERRKSSLLSISVTEDEQTRTVDSGLEDSSDVPNDKEQQVLQKHEPKSLLSSANNKKHRNSVSNKSSSDDPLTDNLITENNSSVMSKTHSTDSGDNSISKQRPDSINSENFANMLFGNLNVKVLVEKMTTDTTNSETVVSDPNPDVQDDAAEKITSEANVPQTDIVSNFKGCSEVADLGSAGNSTALVDGQQTHTVKGSNEKIVTDASSSNVNSSLSSRSSRDQSVFDSSGDSSNYSSYDSNSSSVTEKYSKQDSLNGSFQQIFLKFAQDGNQPINDQKSIMGTSLQEEKNQSTNGLNSGHLSKPAKETVQSNYVLRNKALKTVTTKLNARKPKSILPNSVKNVPSDVHVPADAVVDKSKAAPQHVGFVAATFKRPNFHHATKQNRKHKRRGKRNNKKKLKDTSKDEHLKETVNTESQTFQKEAEEFEAPTYPACFQKRVIEAAEITGIETVCAEFGLSLPLVADWMHSKNSIRMLSKVENFEDWELDLYILVHKLNVKGQRLSLSDLMVKGAEVLNALNLSDCFSFQNENALDWCERFGVGLSDTPPTQCQQKESPEEIVHHRQKHSTDFMIEVCNYALKHTSNKANKKFGVPVSTVRSWILKDLSKKKTPQGNELENQSATENKDLSDQNSKARRKSRIPVSKTCPEVTVPQDKKSNLKPLPDSQVEDKVKKVTETRQGLKRKSVTKKANIKQDIDEEEPVKMHKSGLKERAKGGRKLVLKNQTKVPINLKSFNQLYRNYRRKYVRASSARLTDDFRRQVLEYVKENGVAAAATKYQLSSSALYQWGGGKKLRPVKFSPAVKAKAMAYADQHSITASSKKFCISTSLLFTWRFQRRLKDINNVPVLKRLGPKLSPKDKLAPIKTKKPAKDLTFKDRKEAGPKKHEETGAKSNQSSLTSVKKEQSSTKDSEANITPLSISPRIPPGILSSPMAKEFILNFPKRSPKFIHKVVMYANKHGVKWASRKYGVEYKDVNGWLLRYETAYKSGRLVSDQQHTKDFMDKVVAYALEKSCKSASEHFSVRKSSIYYWIRKANLQQKDIPESKNLETLNKELLSWCQLIQASDSCVRVPKIISKAKALAQQMNLDDSVVNHDWYKDWSAKYKDELAEIPNQSIDFSYTSPTNQGLKVKEIKTKQEKITLESRHKTDAGNCPELQSSTANDSTSSPENINAGADLNQLPEKSFSEVDNDNVNATLDDDSTKQHIHFTRKVNRKFCKFCPFDHHDHEESVHDHDLPITQDPVDTDEDASKMGLLECNSANDTGSVQDSSEQDEENSNSVMSVISKGELTPLSVSTRDKSIRACKSTFRPSSSLSNDSKDIATVVSVKKDEKTSGNIIDVVITDPGWVFCNWLREVNSTRQILSSSDVISKLEFIVLRTHEDYFDNWLFRLYVDVVNAVNHPIVNTKAFSSVSKLDGYVSADVRLEMLVYADWRNFEEASACFQISITRMVQWKESRSILHRILKVKDLFVTNQKNLYIDLDIFEWNLKCLEEKGEVSEEELKSQAVATYLAHNGKSIKRWFKWFVERFQKANALYSVQNDILKKILENSDCNISLSTENVISLYEEKVAEQELKPVFPTSQQWFHQFVTNYSDYFLGNSEVDRSLPGDLAKESDEFRKSVQELRQGLSLNCLGSIDEFPIWFSCKEQTSSTDTEVLPQCGFEDADGVVLFACLASGAILSPFITFRSSAKKNASQQSQHIVTDPVLSQWLQKVWLVEVTQPNSVIILDSYSPHLSAKFKQTAEQSNVQLALVPPGCNSAVHPIATSLRVRFQLLLQELRFKRFADTILGRSEIVSLVNDAYCEIYQERESVRRAFQMTGFVSGDELLTTCK